MSTLFTSGIQFYSIKKGGNRVGIQTLWTHNHIWWWWEWWMLNGEVEVGLKGGTNYHTKKAAAKRWRRRPHAFSWIFSCPPKRKSYVRWPRAFFYTLCPLLHNFDFSYLPLSIYNTKKTDFLDFSLNMSLTKISNLWISSIPSIVLS